MKNVFHILLLFLLAPIQTFAQGDSNAIVQAQADSIIVVDNTIRDTVKLSTNFATIYINEKGHYIAVDADGNEKDITANVGSKSRTLVQSSNGEQLVIDSKGQLMGVTEYKQTGGNKTLLAQRSAEKDSLMATTGNVTFTSIGDYLFDTYDSYKSHTASQNYAQRFLSIGAGNYRPAYACIESYAKVKLNADPYTNITFKTERGVPVICNNGELSITGFGDHDTLAIYAYKDTTLVGKVNVMCYDKVTRKICLVPIGKSNVPSAETLKKGLDAIFAKLMVDFDVTVSEAIEIDYTNGTNFTHGGSGVIGVYNTDQKAAITKLEELGTDNETVYLFMVEDAVTLNETDGYTVTSGYMPRGYQYGFIYKELTNARTIAHEIAHGAFHLEHTFAQSNYLAPEATTDNLMDYNGGTTLNHWQWQDVHDPKRVWLKWAQDESGAEMNDLNIIRMLSYLGKIHTANYNNDKQLALVINKDWSFGKSNGLVEIDTSTKLNYLSMFIMVNNQDEENMIEGISSTKVISIKPYERNKRTSDEDNESYTTYTFKTDQKYEYISFTIKTDECEVFEEYLYGSQLVLKELAKNAVELAILSMNSNSICNVCTRTALYLIKNDSTLFPYEGSALKKTASSSISQVYGYTTNPGRAQHIKEDFDVMKPEYSAVFEEVAKNTSETWQQYFERLQNMANSGEIIIGAMMDSKNETGHVMMITPGDMVETCINPKITKKEYIDSYGEGFYTSGITKVPIVIECGQGERKSNAPLCTNVDRRGAQTRLKWYRYKK